MQEIALLWNGVLFQLWPGIVLMPKYLLLLNNNTVLVFFKRGEKFTVYLLMTFWRSYLGAFYLKGAHFQIPKTFAYLLYGIVFQLRKELKVCLCEIQEHKREGSGKVSL